MRPPRRAVAGLLGLAGIALATSGCASQISALAPVSGDNTYKLRVATIDVLLAKGIAIKVAPTCVQEATAVTCTGTTMDGSPIAVTAPGKGGETMRITVAGLVVFEGTVTQVIDDAATRS